MFRIEKPAELVALEQAFAAANAGGNGYAFVSAPVAISALLDMLDGGSHLVVSDGANPDTYRMIESIRRRSAGLKVGFADMGDLDALELAVTDETRLLWVETVSGPRLSRPDLVRLVEFAKARDIMVLADNSVLGHQAVKPLAEGCDVVFTSAPAGAGRGGLVAFAENAGFGEDRFAYLQRAYDAMPGPAEAEALQLALSTAPEHLAARAEAAARLATFLTDRGSVDELFYPGDGCPDLSVTFHGRPEEADAALARMARFRPGLVPGQPGTFWHYAHRDYEAVPEVIRRVLGIPDGLVRFGVPAEDPDVLIRDFQDAFD
ncbi:PLP-dependent transferase [Nisaea nitritireducens]|uniref:PLP-dependent transferase n=1 Tax=Nisaea nitritireducens TaxID=568392 RepID=UPI001865C252|nr:PLP-dependent transferase [Nisaea nitritireducens]